MIQHVAQGVLNGALHGCVTLLRAAFIVKLVQRLHDNLLLIRAYYGVCEETHRKR